MYKEKLLKISDRKTIKQKEIAKQLNISESLYSRYKKEYQDMPIKHLNTLCNLYDISLDYLFSFTENKNYKNSSKDINIDKMKIRLKEFRKENKLTQVQLAEKLNVVKGTIGNYECGSNIIATPFLYTICKKYNLSADYLLGKIDNPKFLK